MELATLALVYIYGFLGFAFATVADRTGTSGAWMAFVPPFQPFLLLRLSGRSLLWLFFLAVPGVNLLALAVVLGDVAAARKLPPVVGWLAVALPCGVVGARFLMHLPMLEPGLGAAAGSLCLYAGLVAFLR